MKQCLTPVISKHYSSFLQMYMYSPTIRPSFITTEIFREMLQRFKVEEKERVKDQTKISAYDQPFPLFRKVLTQKEKICGKANVTKVPLTSFKLQYCRVMIHTNDKAED